MLYPMLALVGWTLTVLGIMAGRRLTSRLHPREFALGESASVPPAIRLTNRNFMNLLEVPVLFYVVSLTYYVTQQSTPIAVGLAWAFVTLRVAHSGVHMTYNNVMHRLAFFATGNFVLIALWIYLLVRLA